jgi:hypothetical protein
MGNVDHDHPSPLPLVWDIYLVSSAIIPHDALEDVQPIPVFIECGQGIPTSTDFYLYHDFMCLYATGNSYGFSIV